MAGYYVVLFRNRLRECDMRDYEETAHQMDILVASIPGYMDHKSYNAEDGERLTVSRFRSLEAIKAWRKQADHAKAQAKGRREFYNWYNLEVCEVSYQNEFEAQKPSTEP